MKVDVTRAAVSAFGIAGIIYFSFKLNNAVFDTIALLWDAAFIETKEEAEEFVILTELEEEPVLPIYPDEKPPSYEESLFDQKATEAAEDEDEEFPVFSEAESESE